jgi:CRISPR/Cas system-associated protein Cas10 (large subunit of type III CRISPR-Cas system)
MSNVIDIEKRLQLEQKKKAKVDKSKKLEYIRKFLQCKRCLARCSMCGVQFDPQDMYRRHHGAFRFCSSCQEEYEEFRRVKDKGEDTTVYWHNQEWLAIWENWLKYQESLQQYTESTEFVDLLREVDWH